MPQLTCVFRLVQTTVCVRMPMHTWALWIVRTMERNHRRRAYHLWNMSYGILLMTIEGGHVSHGILVMTGLMLDRLGLRSADWVYAQRTGFMLSGLGLCSTDWAYARQTGLMLNGLGLLSADWIRACVSAGVCSATWCSLHLALPSPAPICHN